MAVEFNGAKTYHGLNDPHIVIFYMKANEALRLARMESRGDDPEKIKSRIANDHQAFDMDDSINQIIDAVVDTEKYDIAQAADLIYHDYIAILKKRNIAFTEPKR
jgi:broad-specificity NMP kinase